jgi:hypothetical protein
MDRSNRERIILPLAPRSVATFYQLFTDALNQLDIQAEIYATPVEIPDPIPFAEDTQHASYDKEYVNRWWRILSQTDLIFKEFRGRFLGKCSPVHFFWGSFDHAVTRFSGRPAPAREWPMLPKVMSEAYSHEVISAGFWPGSGKIQGAAYYCYALPEPAGYADATVRPERAYYDTDLSEFILMYDDVRKADHPAQAVLDFLQSTYEAGARLAGWDRPALEYP